MTEDTSRNLTPAAAAKVAGCGRTSIMRALEAKRLKGQRDNRNRWKISREDLEAWMNDRPASARIGSDSDPDIDRSVSVGPDEYTRALAELAAANATVEILRTQVERDDQRHSAEIRRLEAIIDRLTTPKTTFLQRLLGR